MKRFSEEKHYKKDAEVSLIYQTLKGVLYSVYNLDKDRDSSKITKFTESMDNLFNKYLFGNQTITNANKDSTKQDTSTDEYKLNYMEALSEQLGDDGRFGSLSQLEKVIQKLAGNIKKEDK